MKYTIDNPKLVQRLFDPVEYNFTGVVKGKCGSIAYYENGKYHRTDGPAIEYSDVVPKYGGDKEWWIHGELHREDGPAVECFDGSTIWYFQGKYHGFDDAFTVESWINKWRLEIFK